MKLRSLLILLLIPSLAAADVVVLKGKGKLRGGVHRDDESGVGYNPYNSRHPGMVFDVQNFPRSAVKEVIREEPPFQEFLRRMGELKADDFEGRLELAAWCKEQKLKEERLVALLSVLEKDPGNEAALKAYGRSKFEKLRRGSPRFDPAIRAALEEYFLIPEPEERKKAWGRLKRELGVDLPRQYLDRIIRSFAEKKGRQNDRPLSLRSVDYPSVYTLFVPAEYDPRRSWPLVIGLHGGGPGGKEGDTVVGSGASAMNFYVRQAASRGYIVACPTALVASWAACEDQVRAVLEEVELLYNVDLNRVYLTGHSMGGFGAWALGPAMAELWAAVSPMAGGGGGQYGRLVSTNTPVFIFHGADDGVVGPGSDRATARALVKTGHDFIYTELNGVGHGFPDSIQKDLFDFFDVRRLAQMRGRRGGPPSAEVRSSFMVKVSRDEKRYLGDPLEFGGGSDEGGRSEVKHLLKDLSLGGGKAEAAAKRLGELKDEDSVKPLVGLLRNPGVSDDVKVHAAQALGAIGNPEGYKGLAAGLRSEDPEVFTACARAMAGIGAEDAGPALVSSLAHLDKILDGKRIGGNRMHISDWERWLGAMTVVVEGIGSLKAEGGVPAIRRSVVKKVLEGGWDVMYSPRVGQDPKRARNALAAAARAAVTAIGGPDAAAVLAEIAAAE